MSVFEALRTRVVNSRVAVRWSRLGSETFTQHLERVSWSGIPQVHLNHNYLITGSRETYWVDWIRDRFFPDGYAGDTLSLGCGAGHLDRILMRRGFAFRSFTGIDISKGAVRHARRLADEIAMAPPARYVVQDLNRPDLASNAFDFIYFFQSLHHVEALERLLDQCRRALRPTGLLMVNEFVGPSRFQWTSRQLELADAITAALPEELRLDLRHGGLKTAVDRPTINQMLRYDPSESVRSAEIEGLLKERFEVVGEWNWGGTLNHLVFQNIAANFKQDDAYHRSVIERLIHDENTLIESGVLPSDFKVFLARARHTEAGVA